MNRFAFLAVLTFLSLTAVQAQNEKKPEFFGGYSFENIDSGIKSTDLVGVTQTTLDNRFNVNGINLAGTGYLTKRLGITADFSGHWQSRTDFFDTVPSQSKLSLYNVTGGPQLRFPSTSRFTPFVQALAGIAHRDLKETFPTVSISSPSEDSGTSFAMNLGGGVDYRLNGRFAFRLFQLDYNPIFLRSRTIDTFTLPGRTLNGFRFSTGIVIR